MKLLYQKKIGGIDVEISPYGTLNTTKDVVCLNLLNCTEEEKAFKLLSQVVVGSYVTYIGLFI